MWTLEEPNEFPFRLIIKDGDETILSLDRWAYSTMQKTLEDCMNAVGFPVNEREEAIRENKKQRAQVQLIARAPELEAENARLLDERDEWKEKAQAYYGHIEYWKGGYTIQSERIAELEGLLSNVLDLFPEDIGERGNYIVENARKALGEQS